MRLLNARTIELDEFFRESTPQCATLSHRWEDEEITFDDMKPLARVAAETKPGYAKIKNACAQTLKDGFEYIWIDTCCIDKSSSTELQEAINSMFHWYQESVICYVFLSDVSTIDDIDNNDSEFSRSQWFTRGWTLQELLAPKNVMFFSSTWKYLGTKSTLSTQISAITSIDRVFLEGEDLRSASIAHRMSWASKHVTKREEDIAYCLLGIFDVNMPLIYGEGPKAFRRLQEEILRNSSDESFFA
jgi:hypothetical protein